MPEIHVHLGDPGQLQHLEHQADDLTVAGRAGIAVQLGADLDRAARGGQRSRTRMQHTAGVAQTARSFLAMGMGIESRHLRRDVGAKAHLPTGQRIGDLEGAQVEILRSPGKQGLQVFDMRSDDELVAPVAEQIQHLTASRLYACGLCRQHFFDSVRQQPAVQRCHIASPLSAGRGVQRSQYSRPVPSSMLPSPISRSWRSSSPARLMTASRQRRGQRNGRMPSSTSSRQKAMPSSCHMVPADAKKPGNPG
ncbi:hypothetical protein D3C80_1029430 [compost metagenome]